MAGIEKRYGATVALAGVSLEARAGEVLALVGENGAGKSTLMKVLAGALAPDAGEMQLDGAQYRPRGPDAARRAGVAMIHQELALAPHLSVAENVLLGCEPRRGPFLERAKLRARARAALAEVGRGDLDLELPVGRLGPADAQQVEIARAVALEARVLVLDEPTSSLGREDVARLFALVRKLRERGAAIVYISHALEEVIDLADRAVVLRDGASVATFDRAELSAEKLVAAMVGREVSELYPRSRARPGEVVARVSGLRGLGKLREAALELRRGEVLGIAGLVGAGRTELLRALFGLDRVVAGELRVLALDGARGPSERWRQGVGFASEDRKREGLALGLSISDNLCLPRLDRHARGGWIRATSVDAAAREWIARLGIRCAGPAQGVGRLSGGNQQKVALARLLHCDADILLLDEPTRGVDVGAKAEIYRLIDELARGARPRAVAMVSSYLPELFGTCDRIAVMARGALGIARAIESTSEHDVMLEAAGGAR
ncbi:MAG: sugar ABC transporter ATP-binding protein [Planctomycetes bacterium]|nr:sugar ABC transporter ATP-binding protein [Planctomycetota bacterium]